MAMLLDTMWYKSLKWFKYLRNPLSFFSGWSHGRYRIEGACCAEKTQRNFKCLHKKLAQKCLKRWEGNSFMRKPSTVTRSAGRCTELKFRWQEWQGKLAASTSLQNPNWHLSSGSEASRMWAPKSAKHGNFFAFIRSSATTLWQWTRLPSTFWGLWSHMLLSEWADLQGWLWQNQ